MSAGSSNELEDADRKTDAAGSDILEKVHSPMALFSRFLRLFSTRYSLASFVQKRKSLMTTQSRIWQLETLMHLFTQDWD